MAKLKVEYRSRSRWCQDQIQTFIGYDLDDCWQQMKDFEQYLGRDYDEGYEVIYQRIIIEEKE